MKVVMNALAILVKLRWPRWHKLKVAYLRGLKPQDVLRWAEECFNSEISPKIYKPMRSALAELKDSGLEIVLLSGTVDFLAGLVGRQSGVHEYVASAPVIKNGTYTGELEEGHPYGQRKVLFAERVLAKHGCEWANTGALADNYADRFLLQKVAAAVVIKPEAKLRSLAKTKRWGILDYPEDQISTNEAIRGAFSGGQ